MITFTEVAGSPEAEHSEAEHRAWREWTARGVALSRLHAAGDWMVDKWRDQARRLGVFRAASNMRKQGVPFEIALATLQPGAEVRS